MGRELTPEEIVELFATKVPIPAQFFNEETNAPYSHCTKCHIEFSEKTGYSILKHFEPGPGQQQSVLYFAYAVCTDCYEKLGIKVSDESNRRLEEFGEEFSETEEFLETFSMFPEEEDIPTMLNTCVITCQKIDPAKPYTRQAMFVGKQMILSGASPFTISEKGAEMLSNCLSVETKDEFEKVYDLIDLPVDALSIDQLVGVVGI